jgi:hypothetical protein
MLNAMSLPGYQPGGGPAPRQVAVAGLVHRACQLAGHEVDRVPWMTAQNQQCFAHAAECPTAASMGKGAHRSKLGPPTRAATRGLWSPDPGGGAGSRPSNRRQLSQTKSTPTRMWQGAPSGLGRVCATDSGRECGQGGLNLRRSDLQAQAAQDRAHRIAGRFPKKSPLRCGRGRGHH